MLHREADKVYEFPSRNGIGDDILVGSYRKLPEVKVKSSVSPRSCQGTSESNVLLASPPHVQKEAHLCRLHNCTVMRMFGPQSFHRNKCTIRICPAPGRLDQRGHISSLGPSFLHLKLLRLLTKKRPSHRGFQTISSQEDITFRLSTVFEVKSDGAALRLGVRPESFRTVDPVRRRKSGQKHVLEVRSMESHQATCDRF